MKPSIGRIVHYVSYGTPGGEYPSVCRAAIITEVTGQSGEDGEDGELVGLCALNPTGMFFNQGVIHAEHPDAHLGGTWHWPERVEDQDFTVTTTTASAATHTTVRCLCGGMDGMHALGCQFMDARPA